MSFLLSAGSAALLATLGMPEGHLPRTLHGAIPIAYGRDYRGVLAPKVGERKPVTAAYKVDRKAKRKTQHASRKTNRFNAKCR